MVICEAVRLKYIESDLIQNAFQIGHLVDI